MRPASVTTRHTVKCILAFQHTRMEINTVNYSNTWVQTVPHRMDSMQFLVDGVKLSNLERSKSRSLKFGERACGPYIYIYLMVGYINYYMRYIR